MHAFHEEIFNLGNHRTESLGRFIEVSIEIYVHARMHMVLRRPIGFLIWQVLERLLRRPANRTLVGARPRTVRTPTPCTSH